MIEFFLKTVPFFALVGLGYGAAYTRFFSGEAVAYLTKFVFFFALTALLFRFSANLSLSDIWDFNLVAGYVFGTTVVYMIATFVAFLRKLDLATAAVEAQCAAIGNVGFLGVPMLPLLLGEAAIGPIMMALAVDLIIFSSLFVILVTMSRDGRLSIGLLRTVGLGLVSNPMVVAVVVGLTWSVIELPIPAFADEFLVLLGGAATPGALFAIGASLASKSAERIQVAGWLTFCKLCIHPLSVAIGVLYLFPADPYFAGVIIASSALPIAGNVYILAQHYGVAPQRASAAILISTIASVVTVGAIVSMVAPT